MKKEFIDEDTNQIHILTFQELLTEVGNDKELANQLWNEAKNAQ